MKYLLSVILLFSMLGIAPTSKAETSAQFAQHVYGSVVLLYTQNEEGGLKMLCTATAYRKMDAKDTYRFASASHCVSGETEEEQHAAKYFITSDSTGPKVFIPAKLIEAGDKKVGDDFSIFEAVADTQIVPLGDSDKVVMGEAVVDVASPMGLGKQYFQGYISSTLLDRPPIDAGEVQWKNVMLVEIGSGPGSSGSAVISADQKAIIGFLVGGMNGSNIGAIVLPVSKFKTFEDKVDKGTYKKTHKPEAEKLN